MPVDPALAIVSSLRERQWLKNDEAAISVMTGLGFSERAGAAGEQLLSGVVQRRLEPALGIDHATVSSLDGKPTGVAIFISSSPEPANPTTKSEYKALILLLSEDLGSPKRVWSDEPTPLLWRDADLDIGVQLFDQRDSTVMVWVEHRERSTIAEKRALVIKNAAGRSPNRRAVRQSRH
jgi:hypothetical protein